MIQYGNHIFPLEVKANISVRSKSLQVYYDKYHPDLMLRTSMLNLKQDGNILNIPLYLIENMPRLLEIADSTGII